jgi:hypothetical protein
MKQLEQTQECMQAYVPVNNEFAKFSRHVDVIHQTAEICKVEYLAILQRVYINVKT